MTTKDRILDSAERLFAHQGVEATSLRAITKEAGVNLAAVNYHFQSKEALMHAVISRRVDPMNRKRLELLDACESAVRPDGPLPLEQVLDAFLRPVFEMLAGQAREFTPMMGRIFIESADLTEKVFRTHMIVVAERFMKAFQRALPELPLIELVWRLHFVFGAMAHTMSAAKALRVLSNGMCDPMADVQGTMRRMEAFLMGGLTAPLPQSIEEVEHVAR